MDKGRGTDRDTDTGTNMDMDTGTDRDWDKGSYQGESSEGELSRGVTRGLRHVLRSSICMYVSCYCVNVANKRIVFRL
jgi:hypothetical protein